MKNPSLQTLEERYRHAERISRSCNWECNADFDAWHYTSPNTENLIGMPISEVLGDHNNYLKHIHEGDRNRVAKVYAIVAEHKEAYELEYRFQRPDGKTIIFHEYGEPIHSDSGKVLGFRGSTQDISPLREAREDAQRNLERFNFAEKNASMTHWEADAAFETQTYISDNTLGLYETSNEEMLGDFSTFTDRIHPDDRDRVLGLYEEIRDEPGAYQHDFRFIRLNGDVMHIREVGEPMLDDAGEIIGFRGTTQNISDLILTMQELEKSDAYMGAIVETAVDGIITIDGNGIIETVNTATVRLFGYQADELIGNNISMLMPESDADHHDGYLSSYKRTGEAKIIGVDRELVGKRKNGEVFPIKLSVNKMNFGKKESFAGVIRDITDRNTYERQLQEALSRAEDANFAKTEFLSSMSHELRTPLNAIIGFSATISEEVFGPIGNKKYAEYNADINASGIHLLALINDILDVSAIESGKLELNIENVNLLQATDSALRMVREHAEMAKVSLVNSIGEGIPSLLSDDRRIKQILLNLLSNAVKFTLEGGEVDVSAHVHDDGSIVLKVKDTGIGMDAQGTAKAMMKFGQVDSGLNRKHEGTGLGLPLTKMLVELHGGTFEIESEIGEGTLVTIGFPVERVGI